MHVVCVGGGPGGLYLAILLKRWISDCEVTVYERSARGHSSGWGITFWDDLLAQLERADPESAGRLRQASVRWSGLSLLRQGRELRHAGAGGYGLARHLLLEILTERAAELGVRLRYETEIEDAGQFPDADLVVACDGVGSRLRKAQAEVFRPQVREGRNKFIWLGVKRQFDPFAFGFAETSAGHIWFYGYTYGEASTCIPECSPQTWARLGFDQMTPHQAAAELSRIFARELEGQPLMAGDSCWQNFRTVRNETWVSGRTVLLGDAAHTAHFSIGSGTKLALEDAIALATDLQREPDVGAAARAYDEARRPAVTRIQNHASASAAWFENIDRFVDLPDEQFFALLLDRRSRLLGYVPPGLFWFISRASQQSTLIRSLRRGAVRLHDRLTIS